MFDRGLGAAVEKLVTLELCLRAGDSSLGLRLCHGLVLGTGLG
ncbi:MAG TPA: hypothetical protein VK894_05685 [Jiangellales bacterium]|nr:hypothetical protein [Jiangellales bacterium]